MDEKEPLQVYKTGTLFSEEHIPDNESDQSKLSDLCNYFQKSWKYFTSKMKTSWLK